MLKVFKEFLFDHVMSLEPSPDKTLNEFANELLKCLKAFETIFDENYRHSFGINNIKCFIDDKRTELDTLK